MKHYDKLHLLTRWKAMSERIDKQVAAAQTVFGREVFDGPFFETAFEHCDFTTELVALAVGDEHKWCYWFHLENAMGKKALKSGPVGKERAIKTVQDLLWLIGNDSKETKKGGEG